MDKRKVLKKLCSILLVLMMMVPTTIFASEQTDVWDGSIATSFSNGTGTESDPYQVATGAQLAYLASVVNGGDDCEKQYFVLTANIDLNHHEWTPIGNTFVNAMMGGGPYYNFAGTFDGAGYTISHMTIGTADTPMTKDVCGLFGATTGVLKNIKLDTVSIFCNAYSVTSGYYAGMFGSLAGYAAGSITNCQVTNVAITSSTPTQGTPLANWIGGFVGILDENSSITNCTVEGKVTSSSSKSSSIGGFIGELGKKSNIAYCGADVSVTSVKDTNIDIGGFIGKGNGDSDPATIIDHCYATGNVSGGCYAGGFAGGIIGLNVKNSYATGNVSHSYYGASFVGTDGAAKLYYGSAVNCYTTGTVSDMQVSIYAFAPQTEMQRSPFINCYYNNTNTAGENETAIGKSLLEMQNSEFVALLNNGDLSNGWMSQENGAPYCGAESANYSKVNDAIKDANALKADDYKNFSAVTAAINAVKKGMNITQQKIVDDYAIAIRSAIDALEYKDANYDKVNEAIAKIPTDLSIYTDDSVAKLNAAKAAVVTGMNMTQQETVNGFATAIENAIKGLEKKSIEPTNPSNPTDPSDSSNPADTSNPSKPGDSQSPQTEDNSIMLLWVAFLFISAGTLTMTLRKSKQKNKSQDK